MKNIKLQLWLLFALVLTGNVYGQKKPFISVETKNVSLFLSPNNENRLSQLYFGKKVKASEIAERFRSGQELYVTAGMDSQLEPAIRIVHVDGNPSLELKYVTSSVEKKNDNVTRTTIVLRDSVYNTEVKLYYTTYFAEDIITAYSEVKNNEKKDILLTNYASSMLHFNASKYWLTQFHGDWAKEMNMEESELTAGIKVLDSKQGTRANKYQTPVFFLSLNNTSDENKGEVLAGTIAWTGDFKFSFEIDPLNKLHLNAGMNNYASEYNLKPGEVFETPEFIYTYSFSGKGQASRNLHDWARKYQVLDGTKPRMTLLNNWEATYFNFDENQLVQLFDGAADLGVDLFLLDDGWFGNNFPRNDDRAGLGDWQENKKKLPHGIGYLVKEAEKKKIKFGIWLEPEMVNPKSDLYKAHPDWVLKLPNRKEHYERSQLVLDLSNPKVQQFVFDIVDSLCIKNPGLAYIKWDCNRTMTNAYSQYLGNKQSHLFIDYTRGFYKVMQRIRDKYPHLAIMLCSGGGGRTDYGALKYFNEFWASDNTDPLERIYIQWGYSYFFPANTIAAHVTDWGRQSLKFKTDVAMMGRFGYDIKVSSLSKDELQFSKEAVNNYKRISDVIWYGDLYRLVSPYEENRCAVMYVNEDKNRAVFFRYNLNTRYDEIFTNIRLSGLMPDKNYKVKEINVLPGKKSTHPDNDKVYSGEYLMNVGVSNGGWSALTSNVFEIVAE